ncbi:universal stress protein [Polaromonas sp. P2-4]|nr:universal stress protein [Polaromonas sp. P2-4]
MTPRRAAQRLEVAHQLGRRHGAAVAALYAVTPSFVELPFAPEIGPNIAATLRKIDDEQVAGARTMFEHSLASAGVPVSWGEVRDDPVMSAFAQQALYADLLVLGQHDPLDTRSAHVPADFVETVMAISGKPALILPYATVPPAVGETVVIAWKPTREAARAVAAAMPLLQGARRVHVVSWAGEEAAISGERLDLDGYLKLRGVEATWHRQGEEPEQLGEQLLSRAFDLEADLLVMGCYGHSRARNGCWAAPPGWCCGP